MKETDVKSLPCFSDCIFIIHSTIITPYDMLCKALDLISSIKQAKRKIIVTIPRNRLGNKKVLLKIHKVKDTTVKILIAVVILNNTDKGIPSSMIDTFVSKIVNFISFLFLAFNNPLGAFLLLLLFGLVIGFLLSPLETYIHEIGHCIAIRKIKKQIPCFNETLTLEIKWLNRLKGTAITKSNLLKYLSDRKWYQNQISYIAKSGTVYSSAFYAILIIVFWLLTQDVSKFFTIGIGINLFFLFREIFSFFFSSDFKYYRNPLSFDYVE